MAMKYIRKGNAVVLFPYEWEHKATADACGMKPDSAGMFMRDDENVMVFGSSDTLGLKPLPDDQATILKAMDM